MTCKMNNKKKKKQTATIVTKQSSSICGSWKLSYAKHMLPAATCNNAQHIVITKRGLTTACVACSCCCLLLIVVNLVDFVCEKNCFKIEKLTSFLLKEK